MTVLVERTTAQTSKRHPALRRHDLLDADANRLVWWQTDGASLPDARALTVRGRVQRHTTFAGRPVTVLSHCRVTAREHPVESLGDIAARSRYLKSKDLICRRAPGDL